MASVSARRVRRISKNKPRHFVGMTPDETLSEHAAKRVAEYVGMRDPFGLEDLIEAFDQQLHLRDGRIADGDDPVFAFELEDMPEPGLAGCVPAGQDGQRPRS